MKPPSALLTYLGIKSCAAPNSTTCCYTDAQCSACCRYIVQSFLSISIIYTQRCICQSSDLSQSQDNQMPDSVLKSVVVVSTTTAATLAVFGAYWIHQQRQETKTRRAKYTCSCGDVEASIIIPAANYRYSEIPSFQCACADCVQFCDQVLASGSATFDEFCSPGAPHLLLYDSEIHMVKGQEHLKSMKLSTKAGNRRIYAACCGTPMSVSPDRSHLNMIYTPNLKEEEVLYEMEVDLPRLPPRAVFFASKATGPAPPGTANTLLHCLSRLVVLLFLGEKGPGAGFPTVGPVEIGLDSIKVNRK